MIIGWFNVYNLKLYYMFLELILKLKVDIRKWLILSIIFIIINIIIVEIIDMKNWCIFVNYLFFI